MRRGDFWCTRMVERWLVWDWSVDVGEKDATVGGGSVA